MFNSMKVISQEGKQGFLINILRRWRYYRSAYIINICPRTRWKINREELIPPFN